jgi:hypothetical protein
MLFSALREPGQVAILDDLSGYNLASKVNILDGGMAPKISRVYFLSLEAKSQSPVQKL